MGEIGQAYAGCRTRVSQLVRPLDGAAASRTVPACPSWTIHDLLAHMVGVVDDVLNGRLDGVATDAWTAAQVDARRDRTVQEMVDEWDTTGPTFEGFLDDVGDPGRQAVFDLVTHEHDLRGALGAPGARDADAIAIGLPFLAAGFIGSAQTRGVRVRVEADEGDRFGSDDATTSVRSDRFTLVRALSGRRNEAQIRALAWVGDVDAVLPAFTWGPFRPVSEALEE